MEFQPIGVIRTPFKTLEEMPIQPTGAEGLIGRIELDPGLVEGLKDLDGFSHIIALYYFHRSEGLCLTVTPFLDKKEHGVFATRAPLRPNPIGLSILKLIRLDNNIITVGNVDMLDGTPLVDIKPYVPAFDQPLEIVRSGWLDNCGDQVKVTQSDSRFLGK